MLGGRDTILPMALKKLAVGVLMLLTILTGCGKEEQSIQQQAPPTGNEQVQTPDPALNLSAPALTASSATGVEIRADDLPSAVPGSDNLEVSQTLEAIDAEMDALFTSIDQAGESAVSISGEEW